MKCKLDSCNRRKISHSLARKICGYERGIKWNRIDWVVERWKRFFLPYFGLSSTEQYVTAEARKNWNLSSKHYVWVVWTAQPRILEQQTTSSDIHDQEVLDSLSDRPWKEKECQQASIIELTRPDSTRFGNVQCQSHWMGKSPIPGLCNVLYPLGDGWAFYQRFLLYPCAIPVEAYTLGWGQGGRF